MEGGTAHCILFLDANGNDGILVEAEGSDYARKSQLIPNARAIIESNDITAGERQLHAELKAMKTAGLLHKRRIPHGITKADTEIQEQENLIKQDFYADEPLKKEKLYRIPTHRMTRDEVRTVVFRYVFGYYNTIRVTSFNPDGLPPAAYREMYLSQSVAA